LFGEIEEHSTRVSNTDEFIRSRPLSVCETSNAIAGVFDFKKRNSGPFAVTESMKIFCHEAVLGASIELGGFEGFASESLNQELLLLIRRAHLRLCKHSINALFKHVHSLFHLGRSLLHLYSFNYYK
jgi:hypothetical protein